MKKRLKRLFVWGGLAICGLLLAVEAQSVASTTSSVSGTPPGSKKGEEAWFFAFLEQPLTSAALASGAVGVDKAPGGEPGRLEQRGAGIVAITRVGSLEEMTRGGKVSDYGCRTVTPKVREEVFNFWSTFERHRITDRILAMNRLDALESAHPEDAELALLQGLVRLWVINEPDENTTPLRQASFATQALEYFKKAQKLCPGDARIAGWIAPTEMRLGRAVNAPSLVADGVATFDKAIKQYPEFNVFTLVLAQATEERETRAFDEAVHAIHRSFKLCDEMTSKDPACSNGVRVRHNVEGTALLAGDLLTKQGDIEGARKFYEGARKSPDYDTWPFKEVLSKRLETIEERALAFADRNPHNDPPMVSDSKIACASCHASDSPLISQR